MIGYVVAGVVVVAVGVGIVRHRRRRRAEEEQRAQKEQARRDVELHEQTRLATEQRERQNVEAEKRLKEERQRAERQRIINEFESAFGLKFVEANAGWERRKLEAAVDEALHLLGYALNEVFKKESQLEDRKDSVEFRALKASRDELWQRFWARFNLARILDLPVRWFRSDDKVTVLLPESVLNQMMVAERVMRKEKGWGTDLKYERKYSAYVSLVSDGFFLGNLTLITDTSSTLTDANGTKCSSYEHKRALMGV